MRLAGRWVFCILHSQFSISHLHLEMKTLYKALIAASLALFLSSITRAGTQLNSVECMKSAQFFAPLDSPDHRKYAPDHGVKVLHVALDITPNFELRAIEGEAVLTFRPASLPVREISLDAVDLTVQELKATEQVEAYQNTDDKLTITFAKEISADKPVSVTIRYHAQPAKGLYFRTPEMGYKEGDDHFFTQGEEIEGRHWYPCFDSPNAMFTSEVTCRVPEGMTVVSNGRLVSEEKDPATGLDVFHWSQEQPHANYLMTLVAGYFKKLEDKCGDTPLAFLTPPSEFKEAPNSFSDTKDIMSFFEKEIGVPYPWPKYYQICVNDFVAGGMENTSATTLTDSTLFSKETENIHDSDDLISHEMAHQWFGDLVTCKDWSHIWLNEGFATYYETLYRGHKSGRDAMLYQLYERAQQITGIDNDTNPIVRRTYDDPSDMFNYLAYPKGGWVLHMLRSQLGSGPLPALHQDVSRTSQAWERGDRRLARRH